MSVWRAAQGGAVGGREDAGNARTQIVDENGDSAAAGRIRVFPKSGKTFVPASASYYYATRDGGVQAPDPFDPADWQDRDWQRHLPMIVAPTLSQSYWSGIIVPQPRDIHWITDSNDIPTANPAPPTYTIVGSSENLATGSDYDTSNNGIIVHTRFQTGDRQKWHDHRIRGEQHYRISHGLSDRSAFPCASVRELYS